MLGRKQSIKIGDATYLGGELHSGGGGGGGSGQQGAEPGGSGGLNSMPLGSNAATGAAAAAALELAHNNTGVAWFNKTSVRHFMRLCSVASLVSVCANTSRTFAMHPTLNYITLSVDIISGLVFTLEMALKINSRGLLHGPSPYARDRWCQFDATMVLFIWISILLQSLEMTSIVTPEWRGLSVLRSPRPLILIRFIRVFLKFSKKSETVYNPKEKIKGIFERSSQQIYNVTLFFLFFMVLYGLLGVQLFGQIEKHCVHKNLTDLRELSITDLAIPDTHCSGSPHYGNQCPLGLVCRDLHLEKHIVGYNGFNNILHSLYTVYQTSSQEGWSHLMYSTFDHYPAWKVAAYFVSLIFFLGWMVRNVFIAVFTETFNEIRVQFQEWWGGREDLRSEGTPKVLRGDDSGWKLEEIDESQTTSRWVPQSAKRALNSAAFQVVVLVAILANVGLSASIKFEHDGRPREQFYMHVYWWEVGFTVFFNIETLFKIACLGFPCYWTRTSHRFELFLALGCSLHIVPALFMTELADFQVLRVVRLIKASPVLEDFAYKSFGPGRKLGSLVAFTVCLLVVTSAMTMQLFCSLADYHRFEMFPHAFMSMFQILTQEAWTDVMNETILRVSDRAGVLVAFYFILYHLFVSLIVLSLFVAVILDNLELPEDLKTAKQEKAREQIACISEELPLRLRLFERFPDSPQMTKLHKSASDFNVPKVRESFMRTFVDDIDNHSTIRNCLRVGMMPRGFDYAHRLTGGTAGGGVGGENSAQQQQQKTATTAGSAQRGYTQRYAGGYTQRYAGGQQPPGSALVSARATNQTCGERSKLTRGTKRMRLGTLDQRGQPLLARLPSLKLLTTPSKTSSTSKILRKTTISQLIEESNLQRMSLMNDDLALAGRSTSGGINGAVGVAGGRGASGLAAVGSTTIGGGGGGQLRFRGDRSSSLTSKIQQSSYDYLKESSGEGMQENLRNPQDLNIKMLKRKRQQAELKRSQREKDLRENHPLFDTPLFIVGRESKFRKFCQLLAWAKYQYNDRDPVTGKHRKSNYKSLHNLLGLVSYLDWIMIFITTLSCVSMMFETPSMRVMNTPALQVAEYVFVVTMTIELTLKTLANGLVFTPKALLSTTAGLMDTFIFLSSLAYALWMPQEVEPQSLAQYLMLLRCVRPLRVFSLIPHMRQVIYELVRGFKAIFLVCVLLALLCFVFACYGVHIFGGRLARCTDPTVTQRENCTGTFVRRVFVTKMRLNLRPNETAPALLVPRVWANPHRFSFDNIKSAMLALFEVLSFKGWVDIREALLKRFDNSPHWLYIHIFVFFGCMVGVTLFVGVVIANYGENKGTALLTVDQRRWCDLKKRLKIAQPLHLPPRPDHVRFRAIIYDIIQAIQFKRTIAFLVLCNSALLIVHWDPDESHTLSFATISACLTLAFTIEVIMKMIAFTPRGYWQSRRNRYDLAVTVIGCAWVLVHFVLTTSDLSNTFGYIAVILRFFTITGKHATLQMLMLTVVVSVYKSFFIILGLFVLVLFYSLLGVQLFGSVKFGENLSRQANFRSAKLGTITMFRIVTGEDWYRMMHDCMILPPYCTKGKNYWETDCGHLGISFAFFSSFYIIITHVVLNLLVAIIMENFSLFYSSDNDTQISHADIRHFQNIWNMVDLHQRGYIPARRVKFVLRLLEGRLKPPADLDGRNLIKHLCHEMERLHNGEDVSFHDVLSMLALRVCEIDKSLQFEELIARKELENTIEEEVAKKTIRSWLDQCLRRVRQQRQQNSLIQGLKLNTMSGADFFMSPTPAPAPAAAPAAATTAKQSQQPPPQGGATSHAAAAAAEKSTSKSAAGDHSPVQTPSSEQDSQGLRRLTSSSTSESQHSLSSPQALTAAGSATAAAAAGAVLAPTSSAAAKLRRRADASRSESICVATGAGGLQASSGKLSTSVSVAPSAHAGPRKLLSTQSGGSLGGAGGGGPAPWAEEKRQAEQLRRTLKAQQTPGAVMSRMSFSAGSGAAGVPPPTTTTTTTTTSATAAVTTTQVGGEQTQALRETTASFEDEAKQQFKPKLNAAISDIHEWWNFQIN